MHTDVPGSESFLIVANVHSLRQALDLLERLDDRHYVASPPHIAPHKVGGHVRHIVEFYECFFEGVESRQVDYDSRRRDITVEGSRIVAIARIRTIVERLENGPALRGDAVVRIRMEDAPEGCKDCFLTSSVARELQVLNSHTVHHFALIAMTLKSLGLPVDREFGVAPSTLRHAAAARSAARVEAA
jgi:hypothetical protein